MGDPMKQRLAAAISSQRGGREIWRAFYTTHAGMTSIA